MRKFGEKSGEEERKRKEKEISISKPPPKSKMCVFCSSMILFRFVFVCLFVFGFCCCIGCVCCHLKEVILLDSFLVSAFEKLLNFFFFDPLIPPILAQILRAIHCTISDSLFFLWFFLGQSLSMSFACFFRLDFFF